MKIPFSLDVVVPKILEFGMLRYPYEACGVIVPDLNMPADLWVTELKNRSLDPLNSYKIDPETIATLLVDPDVWEDVLIWHTHPSGHIGPSEGDMKQRDVRLKYLVVALPGGEATMF
jgi:proteasome lid subunit RPN8/RPN11